MRYVYQAVFGLLCIFTICYSDNPVIQTCFTADPAPLVYNGKVYLYVGVDSSAAPASSYLMRYWKCFSSGDMVNWTDHGIALATKSITWSGGDANAAQVIFRNGKFYYYISTGGSGGIAIGVATATSPSGPFTDAIGKPLIINSQTTYATHSWDDLDPTVFIDDNDQAYMYWGNNACYVVKLKADMISTDGTISAIPLTTLGPNFEEAPWFYKRGSLYYLIFAEYFPESIAYATSSNPAGPWTFKNTIMAKQSNGVSNTIHPGIIDFGGNSYFFYHNAGLTGGTSYKRSVCIEQFNYNADGTIPVIKETKDGVIKGVGNLNPYDTVQAETICWSSGVHTAVCSEGGMMVDSIHNGDYIKVKGVDFSTGASKFSARIASATSGTIELRLDSPTGTLIGTCAVETTGSMQTWLTKTCTVSGVDSIHDLYLKFTGGSGVLFNLNWWQFGLSTGTKNAKIESVSQKLTISENTSGLNILSNTSVSSNQHITIKLLDIKGRVLERMYDGELSSGNLRIPFSVSRLPSGYYIVAVTDLQGSVLVNKPILK